MSPKKIAHFSPGRLIFFSIFITILIGTTALALPWARTKPVALLDLFFTATSVTCVTGLFTVPLDSFTTFGHAILLLLIQIGGLGLITLTIFLLSLFVNFGLATQVMAGRLLDLDTWKNIREFIVFIIILTLAIELIGALSIFPLIYQDYTLRHALFLSVFHSVSSFCNAGISLFPGGGLHQYATSYTMLTITIVLMFAGAFGFIAWHEIMRYIYAKFKRKRHPLSLNTKIIVYSSVALILGTTIALFSLEYHGAFAGMGIPLAALNSLFHAVASRSSGILTVDIHALQLASLFLILMTAFIGAAPGSTGSGVKLTTFAIFLATMKAAVAGRISVEIRGRSIPIDQVYKAIAIVSLSIFWIVGTTFLLLVTETEASFFEILLEVISAFATLGISTGITASLSLIGKLFIITSMIIGRIGSLTLVLALRELRYTRMETVEFSYPEERVLLG